MATGNDRHAVAFAPAGVGNAAVGFDLIGHALDTNNSDGSPLGDRVSVRCTDSTGVEITEISGLDIPLPRSAAENTAGRPSQSPAECLYESAD